MTKTFCDRCGCEVTLDEYQNRIHSVSTLHRRDLGLQRETKDPFELIVCGGCYESFKSWIRSHKDE